MSGHAKLSTNDPLIITSDTSEKTPHKQWRCVCSFFNSSRRKSCAMCGSRPRNTSISKTISKSDESEEDVDYEDEDEDEDEDRETAGKKRKYSNHSDGDRPIRRKKKKKKKRKSEDNLAVYNVKSSVDVTDPPLHNFQTSKEQTPQSEVEPPLCKSQVEVYEIEYSEINHDHYRKRDSWSSVSVGTYSTVYKARWLHTPVAVKLFRNQTTESKHTNKFWSEVSLLSTLQHPNIVQLVGVCSSVPHRCLVMEWLPINLANAIEHKEPSLLQCRASIAADIVRGLLRLHGNKPHPILHRDMKPENILLTKDWRAKLADLGLSRKMTPEDETKGLTMCGTLRYKAPELIGPGGRKGLYTSKADIYSYGLILWEMISGDKPYLDLLDSNAMIRTHKKKGLNPVIPEGWPPEWARLVRDCWTFHPENRPTASEILLRIASFPKK